MIESPSLSCRTDDGRGEACREGGLEVIGVGECPRSWAFGILPAVVSGQSTTNGPNYRSSSKTESRADGNDGISFLFIPSDPASRRGRHRRRSFAQLQRLAGPIASRCVVARSALCKQPLLFRLEARTGHQPANYHRGLLGKCRQGAGSDPGGLRSEPSLRVVGNCVSGGGRHATCSAGCRWCNGRARTRLNGGDLEARRAACSTAL
jgi:hypothetical protein